MYTHKLKSLSPGFPNASANYYAHIPTCTEADGKGNSSALMFILSIRDDHRTRNSKRVINLNLKVVYFNIKANPNRT